MFWRYNLITGSCIDTLLDKEDVTLKELLDEEDILQECKAQTRKLIDFLIRTETLEEMIMMITQEPPSDEANEQLRYKYANRACELLTFDVAQINDAIVGNEEILLKLYSFLKTDEHLNPLLASFFSKTMGLLISKRTEVMFDFLKDKNIISLILNHLDTSAIMDLLMRFVMIENNDMRSIVISWLNEQKLIQQLVSRIDCEYDREFNCNASQALCDIIKSSREYMSLHQDKADSNPLLETVESVEVIQDLLNHMFKNVQSESAIVNGIAVLQTLLVFKKPMGVQQIPSNVYEQQQPPMSDNVPACISVMHRHSESSGQVTALDTERLAHGVCNVQTAITPRLEDFRMLFLKPPSKPAITLTIGHLDPPLGICRLEVAHLVTILLYANSHLVNVKLAELESIIILMNLFFQYSWNNFLHTQVEQAIGLIITNAPTVDSESNKVHPLLNQLLTQYRITEKILECFGDDCDKPSVETSRKGYMGHLTKIANHIVLNIENGANSDLIKSKISELSDDHQKKWDEFVTKTLAEINKKNKMFVISGFSPTSTDEDSVDFRDVPFGKDSSVHLAFADYQMHEMTSNFVDQFGFNDDEFGDADESLIYARNVMNPLSQNFQSSDNSAALFEEVCRSKSSSGSDGVLWDDNEGSPTLGSQFSRNDSASDSDEESQVFETPKCKKSQGFDTEDSSAVLSSDDNKMDIDNQEVFGGIPMDVVPSQVSNPWESVRASNSSHDNQANWADFNRVAEVPNLDDNQANWADFSRTAEVSSSSGNQENWADFSNFSTFGSSTNDGFDINTPPTSSNIETSEVKFSDSISSSQQEEKKFE